MKIIGFAFLGLLGFTLGHLGVAWFMWQFWAIIIPTVILVSIIS